MSLCHMNELHRNLFQKNNIDAITSGSIHVQQFEFSLKIHVANVF